ncbi:MAG: citrate synthase [Chloroflexota bacterium]|nr:citrate synthase [Chloroflexota bacterium]MDE2942547.1 citrate synthase [Chloroflexota bacterium]MDE3268114.1 citrate synthase [Chloroflexota bacterium]
MVTPQYSPGLEGVISNVTRLSYLDVDDEVILIRGYDLIDLARSLKYVDVAHLVMYGDLPDEAAAQSLCDALKTQCELPEDAYRLLELLPKDTNVMDALRTGISFLAGYEDPDLLMDTSREANLAKGVRLLARAPAIAVNAYRALNDLPVVRPDPSLGYAENFLYMIRGEKPDAESLEGFDRILTCYIEHEMANSTFAARVIGSTLADVYGALTGAVASLKGPLHGGANEAAISMLLDILHNGGEAAADEYVMDKLRQRARIMGFGHRVYMRRYDPRALFLRDYIEALADHRPEGRELHAIYRTVEEVMLRERGLYPNADYPIALLFYLLDIPVPLDTPIFQCARIAGLVAHVIEQQEENRLFRPRVQYEGPRGLHAPSGPIAQC